MRFDRGRRVSQLILDLSGVQQDDFKLDFDFDDKLKVHGVELLRNQLGWNASGDVSLQIIDGLSGGLVNELGLDSFSQIGDLTFKSLWADNLWELLADEICSAHLLRELQL